MSTETPVNTELVAQGGYAINVYEEANKLKAGVVLNTPQGSSKNYKGLEVCIDGAADLCRIRCLNAKAQERHVHLCFGTDRETTKVVIRKKSRLLIPGQWSSKGESDIFVGTLNIFMVMN
jgi:hypothetical protein